MDAWKIWLITSNLKLKWSIEMKYITSQLLRNSQPAVLGVAKLLWITAEARQVWTDVDAVADYISDAS